MKNCFDYERASRVLAQAALEGDAKAARSENITIRTVQNYRVRLKTDETLSQFFAKKKAVLEREWTHKIAPAQRAALDFLLRAMSELDPSNPEAVHSAAGALKIITECGLVTEVIRVRLAQLDRPHAESSGQSDSGHAPALN